VLVAVIGRLILLVLMGLTMMPRKADMPCKVRARKKEGRAESIEAGETTMFRAA